jgi:hypothetical protein
MKAQLRALRALCRVTLILLFCKPFFFFKVFCVYFSSLFPLTESMSPIILCDSGQQKGQIVLRYLTKALSKPRKAPTPDAPIDRDKAHGIVGARSHGNVRLQTGKFYTQKDVDDKYAQIREITFAE